MDALLSPWLGGGLVGAVGILLAVYYRGRARFLEHIVGDSRSTLNTTIARGAADLASLAADVVRRDALIRTLTKELNKARAQLDALSTPEVLRDRFNAIGNGGVSVPGSGPEGQSPGGVPGSNPAPGGDPVPGGGRAA